MRKIKFFAALLVFALIFPRGAECAFEQVPLPLEVGNESGREITGVFIARTGTEEWSENRLEKPLSSGASQTCDIAREKILGLVDVKITFKDEEPLIWRRAPILEIFSVTLDENLRPNFERIRLCSC